MMPALWPQVMAGMVARGHGARAPDPTKDCPTARVGIVPDHVALRRHPFEPVVHASILAAVRTLRVIKRTRMCLAEPLQHFVEPWRRGRRRAMTLGQSRNG